MLPFLKDKEGAASGPVETKRREPDEEADYDLLDAVAEDILEAIEKKDRTRLKEALASLCDYLMDMDEEQDEELLEDE